MDIDTILDNENWDRSTVIQKMVDCGWVQNPDGSVSHEDVAQTFPDWISAILACLEFASNM